MSNITEKDIREIVRQEISSAAPDAEPTEDEVSRRDFINAAGLAGLGLMGAGGQPQNMGWFDDDEEDGDEPSFWDRLWGRDGDESDTSPTTYQDTDQIGTADNPKDFIANAITLGGETRTAWSTSSGGQGPRTISYELVTDGSTVDAYSREYENLVGYSSVGNLLNEIFVNHLPPVGVADEAQGMIRFAQGEYPGKVSDQVLPMGVALVGERSSHYQMSNVNGIPMTKPPVIINTGTTGFKPPSSDNSVTPYILIEDIQFSGPGAGTSGSVVFDSTATDAGDIWDFLFMHRVAVGEAETVLDLTNIENHVHIDHCNIFSYGNSGVGAGIRIKSADIQDQNHVERCDFWSKQKPDSHLEISGNGTVIAHRNRFTMNGGAGTAAIRATNGSSGVGHSVKDNKVAQKAATTGRGILDESSHSTVEGNTVVDIAGGPTDPAIHIGNGANTENASVRDNTVIGAWPTAILVDNGIEHMIASNDDDGSPSTGIKIDGSTTGGGAGSELYGNDGMVGISTVNSPTRLRHNGTVLLSAAPSATNYDSSHAGLELVDTSTSPPTAYWVMEDGTLTAGN